MEVYTYGGIQGEAFSRPRHCSLAALSPSSIWQQLADDCLFDFPASEKLSSQSTIIFRFFSAENERNTGLLFAQVGTR